MVSVSPECPATAWLVVDFDFLLFIKASWKQEGVGTLFFAQVRLFESIVFCFLIHPAVSG